MSDLENSSSSSTDASDQSTASILDTLSDHERVQLQEFCTITGSEDMDAAVRILQSREWNLQFAIQAFFEPEDGSQPTSPAISPLSNEHGSGVEGSQLRQRLVGSRRDEIVAEMPRPRPAPRPRASPPAFSWAPLFTWPFHLVLQLTLYIINVVLSLAGLRRIASEGIPGDNGASAASGSQESPDTREAARFRAYFEREFGADHPPFFAGTYSRALEAARSELKYLVIILWSKEHDDAEVLGQALVSPALSTYLSQSRFIVWVGDVSTTDGYYAANTLGTTRYPMIALAAQTSQSYLATSSNQANTQVRLQVLARVEGLPSRVSPEALSSELVALVDRSVNMHDQTINTARFQREEQMEARAIRARQEEAYQASLARDREREQQAREKEERERAEREQEEKRLADEQRAKERRERWKWATFARIHREAQGSSAAQIDVPKARLNLRLEDGTRVLETFSATDTMQKVFDFVETRAVAEEWKTKGVTPFGDHLDEIVAPEEYEHEYDFVLVSQFPRSVFEDRSVSIKDALSAKGLWPSAALIVEPFFEPED
ncbi:Ubx domain-containing protein [Coemansia sp. Benny D115]|nr:Ubx domain-containing protein [Coemansia sp. Benny D115]